MEFPHCSQNYLHKAWINEVNNVSFYLLGAGATFGEVALISEDCVRTASIITDEQSDVIVIDRQLYNRSVKEVLQKVHNIIMLLSMFK